MLVELCDRPAREPLAGADSSLSPLDWPGYHHYHQADTVASHCGSVVLLRLVLQLRCVAGSNSLDREMDGKKASVWLAAWLYHFCPWLG